MATDCALGIPIAAVAAALASLLPAHTPVDPVVPALQVPFLPSCMKEQVQQ